MLNLFRASRSNILVWVLMGLLMVGLVGFGIGGGGIAANNVARVGEREISADAYARALDQELRGLSEQIGRGLDLAEARRFGIDRVVLARLIGDAALDGEVARLGLSTGDATVREQVLATPGFQGPGGEFDRATYTFALERAGLDPREFEALLRREATRNLIAAGVQSATDMPDAASLIVLGFLGERRRFDWLRLDADLLAEPIPTPTDAELAAEHAAFPERYTRPETQALTYASLTPEALAARIEIPEAELRAAYEAAAARFATPERRILDRIGFGAAEEAAAAKARLDAGEIDFDALATERGLSSEDIDQGLVPATGLEAEARAAVFDAAGPGVVGPVATPLGPSLYRINGILAASTTPFEAARAELARELALDQAEARIADAAAAIEDLLAGGATLEEIAAETEMELGALALNAETAGGLADDPAFRELAAAAEPGETTDLLGLASGGIASLRVDAVEPPALLPLAETRDRVAADWTAARTAERLGEQADVLAEELRTGAAFAVIAERIGRAPQSAGPLTRGDTAPEAPPALIAEVFAAEPDGVVMLTDGAGVILAQVTEVAAFDPQAEENAAIAAQVRGQFRDQAAQDVLALLTGALRDAAGVRVNQDALDATLAQFP